MTYYTERREPLLKDFDRTAALMEEPLIAQYSREFALALQEEVRQEFQYLIPVIPYIEGMRARMLNTFLLITAQELAVYKAMKKHGKSPQEAWKLCHAALRLRLVEVPSWKRELLRRFMFSRPVRMILKRRARQQLRLHLGDFEVGYVIGDGDEFDFGVNYLQCGNLNFLRKHDGEEFGPYVCMSDIVLSDAMGWGLIRTQTLADGCEYCDFRFKKEATTQISSKTPEVQETIEEILNEETKHSVAAQLENSEQ